MISLTGGRAISGYGRSAANPLGPQIQFASESFIDEIAAAIGTDPVAFRLPYLKAPRDIRARLPPERPQRGPPSSPPPSPGARRLVRDAAAATARARSRRPVSQSPKALLFSIAVYTRVSHCKLLISTDYFSPSPSSGESDANLTSSIRDIATVTEGD
jgi:CO/xanthine dehydrogenase Mo-binding subunit